METKNVWQEFKNEQKLYAIDVRRGLISRAEMRRHALYTLRRRLAA